jgi:hypothetical protein
MSIAPDYYAILKQCTKPDYAHVSLVSLARSPLNNNELQQQCFRTAHFEKVLCRSAFMKQFGLKQCGANVHTGFALNSIKSNDYIPEQLYLKPAHCHFQYVMGANSPSVLKKTGEQMVARLRLPKHSHGFVFNVHWAGEQLARSIKEKKNVKAVISDFIYDVQMLFRLWRGASPLKGVKVVVKGLLAKKRNMAQKAIYSVGAVPLGTVKAHVDLDQRVVQTKFGSVGLKVWLCYPSN